jgi:hypothetical protein
VWGMASGVTARFCRCRAIFIGNLFFTASSSLLPNLMRIALVIGKHQSIIRIRQILKLENFDLAEGIFGASGIFTRVLAGAYSWLVRIEKR